MADQPVRRPPTLAAAPVRLSGLLPGAGELSVTGVSLVMAVGMSTPMGWLVLVMRRR